MDMSAQIPVPKHPAARAARQRWQDLRQGRIPFETEWEDIARLIRPQKGGFSLDTPTTRALNRNLNSEGAVAHGHFASGIYAGITNPASRWGGLATPDEDLNRWPPFAEWLDAAATKIHNSFSPALSSFYSSAFQVYGDLAAFGNGAGYDEIDLAERKFIDVTLPLGEIVVDIDAHGRVIEVVRRVRFTPAAATRHFKNGVPEAIAKLARDASTQTHVYHYHVQRNEEFEPFRLGPKGKRWSASWSVDLDDTLLRQSGFDEMPFYYPRWDVDGGFCYGTGPGSIALSSARKLDLMEQATIRAAQRAADPVRLAPDRNAYPLEGNFRPGAVVYNAVNFQGQPLVRSEDFTGNIGLTLEEKRAAAEAIKEAFYYSVMGLTGRTGVSDAENRVIEEARLRNWAPHADRIMEEFAARKFERRFRHLWRAGQIPPPPDGVPAGLPLQVRYTSAAAMALRAAEAGHIRQFVLGDIAALAQIKPEVLDRISADDLVEVLHDASPALPQRLLIGREQAMAERQARAQAMQAQQAAQLAREGGAGLRDLAQAGATMAQNGMTDG